MDNKCLLEKLKSEDIYKIAYSKGLADGRELSQQIQALLEKEKNINTENVIRLVDDQRKKSSS